MKKIDREALAEVDEIISIMPIDDANKIPNSFKNFIKNKKSDYYKPVLRKDIPLHKQNLKEDTFTICSLIYRSYLCGAEERQKLDENDKMELDRIEQELSEKYSSDNLFKNKTQTIIQQKAPVQNNIALVEVKEKFFTKFIKKIKDIFHIK